MRSKFLKMMLTIASVTCTSMAPSASWGQAQQFQAPRNADEARQFSQMMMDRVAKQPVTTEIPTNFPVPVYPSNVKQKSFTHSVKGVPTAAATIFTSDDAKIVATWYQSSLGQAGWAVQVPSAQSLPPGGQQQLSYQLRASKDRSLVRMSIMRLNKTKATLIQITWIQKPS